MVYDILQEAGAGKQCSECDQYPNLSEGADRVGGQLRGDKECPFCGVTKSGRVWRKVPESDARSVGRNMCAVTHPQCQCQESGRCHDSRVVAANGYRCL